MEFSHRHCYKSFKKLSCIRIIMVHKHKVFEIRTDYFKDKPAKVYSTKCRDCGKENKELRQLMQDREDATFKLYGNKSPYVLMGQESVSEKALVDADDPRLKVT